MARWLRASHFLIYVSCRLCRTTVLKRAGIPVPSERHSFLVHKRAVGITWDAINPSRTANVIPMTRRTLCRFQNMIKLTNSPYGKLCRVDNWLFIQIN
ncbi:uncharacterized protein Asalp_34240 [Aeromonas salmonicida subsp. pectinolytica 34mel]|uniref:Uncharacterized protein n=1 Tax=Aeromonas salmonicida subsp. pectinolytica 34mel TaxID=1324960 RepID=A0A2D1QJI4_AERSA|nr:uncharacterized protein Asalp_34240 [Aeromonas salmonicida subsp. pectinolytica 34mel]